MNRRIFACILLLVGFISGDVVAQISGNGNRPFYMGFTRWPPEATIQGIQTVDNFIAKHADLVSLHLDNGIPWQESLQNKPYSLDVVNRLKYRPPAGYKFYVAISPLNMFRDKMAGYWGEKDNQPLPDIWNNLALDNPQVIKAYANYALRVVEATKPDYFVFGVEVNELISNTPSMWPSYVALHKATYLALKARHPKLPVFTSFNVLHWKGIADKSNKDLQDRLISEIIPYVDAIGLSYYPFMSYATPDPLPEDYLAFATQFGKPVAMTETGFTSANVMVKILPLFGSEKKQKNYYDYIFRTAKRDKHLFIITFCTTDFEKLAEALPDPLDDFAGIWKYTGLQTSSLKPKPALATWNAMLSAPYKR